MTDTVTKIRCIDLLTYDCPSVLSVHVVNWVREERFDGTTRPDKGQTPGFFVEHAYGRNYLMRCARH